MKVYVFDLLPYGKRFEEFSADGMIPYPLPGRHFDAETAARTYYEHLEIWREMDALGYDGVGLNEHHTTPHGLMNSPNMMAAVAAQHTKKLKFLILGNLLPLHNPLRIAEELAMADVLERALRSRQRIDTNSVSLNVGGRYVIIDGELVEARAAQLAHMPHNQVYAELRDYVIRLVEAELQRGGVRDMAALDISPRGAAGREIDNYLERAWPNLTPQAFLLELFSTRRRLDAAAAGLLHPDLNLGNILVAGDPERPRAWLIDLDRARMTGDMKADDRVAMQRRLNRSREKLESQHGQAVGRVELIAFGEALHG